MNKRIDEIELIELREHFKNLIEYYRRKLAWLWEDGQQESELYIFLTALYEDAQDKYHEIISKICPSKPQIK